MSINRICAVLHGDGTIRLQEECIPEVTHGMVLIKVACSLVSPGTELKGWDALAAQRKSPALLPEAKKFGYSVAGIVESSGDGVHRFQKGDRVAAIGAGFAIHSDFVVVPQNLCIKLPDAVTFDQGAYSMLLATALQAVRRAKPSFGEYWAVSGLGIVGLLTAQMLVRSGCRVAGIDPHPARRRIARKMGVELAVSPKDKGISMKLNEFTGNEGLDGAVVAFGGLAQDAMDLLVSSMKLSPDLHHEGTIVTVGWPEFDYYGEIGKMNNIDLRRSSRTGCGYHDAEWELSDRDYPPVFVRWTTQRNLALCLEYVEKKRINVDWMTTHHIPLRNVEAGIAEALDHSGDMLGVIFTNEI